LVTAKVEEAKDPRKGRLLGKAEEQPQQARKGKKDWSWNQ
jgi:hypothetical protein